MSLQSSVVKTVSLADNSQVPVVGQGDIVIQGSNGPVTIRDVLYVPNLSHCLFSVYALYEHKRGKVEFSKSKVRIFSNNGGRKPVLTAWRDGNGWTIKERVLSSSYPGYTPSGQCLMCTVPKGEGEFSAFAVKGDDTAKSKGSWQVWHARLGHPGMKQLKHLSDKGLATGMILDGPEPKEHSCVPCLEGKMPQAPFKSSGSRAKAPFDLIHTDLMGPMEVQ